MSEKGSKVGLFVVAFLGCGFVGILAAAGFAGYMFYNKMGSSKTADEKKQVEKKIDTDSIDTDKPITIETQRAEWRYFIGDWDFANAGAETRKLSIRGDQTFEWQEAGRKTAGSWEDGPVDKNYPKPTLLLRRLRSNEDHQVFFYRPQLSDTRDRIQLACKGVTMDGVRRGATQGPPQWAQPKFKVGDRVKAPYGGASYNARVDVVSPRSYGTTNYTLTLFKADGSKYNTAVVAEEQVSR
jgi:hypothetical protein